MEGIQAIGAKPRAPHRHRRLCAGVCALAATLWGTNAVLMVEAAADGSLADVAAPQDPLTHPSVRSASLLAPTVIAELSAAGEGNRPWSDALLIGNACWRELSENEALRPASNSAADRDGFLRVEQPIRHAAKEPFFDRVPFSGEQLHVYLPAKSATEIEPGTIRPSIAGLAADEQRSVVGGQMQLTTSVSQRGRAAAETRLLWLCEFLQTDGTATPFFSPGDQGIFVVQGLNRGNNWALLGGGMRWELAGGWTATVNYDAQVNGQDLFHIGSAWFVYVW